PSHARVFGCLVVSAWSAVSSLVILFMPSQFVYIEALRDMWEAVVVYSFFCLILARCGGEDACAGALSRDPGSVRHPQPVPFLLRLWKKILRLPPTEAAALTPPAGRCFGPEAPTHATARPTSSDKSAQRERRTAGETNFYVREPSRREVYGRQTRRHSGAACCFGEDSMFLCREDLPTDLAFVKCCKRWILQFIFLQFHPVAKFLAMKLVIVATWYQAFFLGIIDGMTVRDVT
ncbi:putative transmembrane protein, partial [Toxoplasma gondii p89]